MNILKTLNKSKLILSFVLIGSIALVLPACKKSRLRVRPKVATTPQKHDVHRPSPTHPTQPGPHEPVDPIIPDDTDKYKRPKPPARDDARIPRDPPPETLGGVPGTTVENNSSKTEVVATNPRTGADLDCLTCPKDDGKLPDKDIPDVPKEPKDPPIVVEPTEPNTQVTLFNGQKNFDHFHLLLVVDPAIIRGNRLKPEQTKNAENKRVQIVNTIMDFLASFDEVKPQLTGNSSDSNIGFTLGLVAGTDDARYSGQYFNDTKEQFHVRDAEKISKTLMRQFKLIANDGIDVDKTHPITVGNNYVSLQKFIESNPDSVKKKTKFLSENIPTVVLNFSYSKDHCNFDGGKIPKACDNRHSYGAILRTLIKKKVFGSKTAGIFAPVTFKHILVNSDDTKMMTIAKEDNTTIMPYDANIHGAAFAQKTLVKQIIDKPSMSFSEISLTIQGQYDQNCFVDNKNKYVTSYSENFTNALATIYDNSAPTISSEDMCKKISTDEFKKLIIDKLVQDELDILN